MPCVLALWSVASGTVNLEHDLQNLQPERHQQVVEDGVHKCTAGDAGPAVVRHGLFHEGAILRHLRGLEDERGVRSGIARRELLERGEVARIRDDNGELLELIELVDGITHNDFPLSKP